MTLVGAENLAALSGAVSLVREERWAASSVVDGAADRVTQLGALGDVGFVYTVRVDRGNLPRVAERLPRTRRALEAARRARTARGRDCVSRALSRTRSGWDCPRASSRSLSRTSRSSFLPPGELLRFLARVTCSVRRGFRLLGVVAALRDVAPAELRHAAGPAVAAWLLPNPYEVAA